MDLRETRFGLNEAIFREVNERIKSLANLFKWGEPEPLTHTSPSTRAMPTQR
jgi:hypothetical protein